MKRLIKTYVLPYRKPLAAALFFMALAGAMTAAIAQLMRPVLDDILSGKERGMIVPVALLVFGTFVVRGVATYLHTTIMNKVSQQAVGDIQKDLFSHFMTLDLAFFHANPSGQLISRVVNDVNVIRLAVSESLTGVFKSALTVVFLVMVMLHQDWRLTIMALAIFPFVAGFVNYLGRKIRSISATTQMEMGVLSDRLSQIFQGIRQVHAYGMEHHEKLRAHRAIDKVRKLYVKAVRVGTLSTPVSEIIVGAVAAGIIIYGGYETAAGRMTTGQLAAFLTAFSLTYEPMKKLAKINYTLQTGLGAAQRVFEMLDLKPAITDRPEARELKSKNPEVVFKDVEFQYAETDEKALRGISFTAPPGKVTALVGPSGGGKSTIINLIPRFYDVKGGSVSVGGYDVRDLTVASLRRNIALVSQDITIFDDTVLSNIAYGRPEALEQEIFDAAEAAAAHEFICALPEGYSTKLGEDGVKLSGGQKQRIAIARAILRNAPILLLDEATSALDNESEKAIQKAFAELEKGRTTIVIAHRLSTVQTADQIIVMDRGQIAEQGKHEELLKKDGLYAKMYRAGLKE